MTSSITSVSAISAWAPNTAYVAGDLVTYNGQTYKCLQAHTSLVGWEPPNVPALWQLQSGTPAPTNTPTPTPTAGPTNTPTPTPTVGPTNTPTPTAGPTNTPTPTPSAGPTATPTPTYTATPTPTPTPTAGPTNTPTPSPTPGGIPAWQTGVAYVLNDLVTYSGSTYKCTYAHTSQVGWEPPNVPTLWQLQTSGTPTPTPTSGPTPTPAPTAKPYISGSYLQPDLADKWDNTKWQSEFGYMKAVGVTQLFLQWTADSKYKTTIYPSGLSGYTQNTTHDVVSMALTNANSAGIDVYLGLQTNDDWWGSSCTNTTWVNNEAAVANQLADDLWAKYGSNASFKGWYLSFELDNWRFLTQADWDRMVSFYQTVANHIHTLSPGKPVVIAPFYNPAGGQTSAQWQAMWEYILTSSPIDVMALQDGVGAGHATLAQLPEWFNATKNAINNKKPSCQLWSDAENYNLDWQPMGIKGFVDDIKAVATYVSNYLSFSYNHYTSPQQVNPIYQNTYKDYVQNGVVESSAPSVPAGLQATAVDSMTINLSWNASTDNFGIAGYKIYRNNELVWKLYSNTTSFTDSQLSPSTTYNYQVLAFDAAGNESALCTQASATTGAASSYPTNLASGKTYTATMAADPTYPDSGNELTNGVYATNFYADGAWQGRCTSSVYSFTIDLGASKSIKEVDSNWMQYKTATILLPTKVSYYVSSDNANFTLLGTVNEPAVSDSTWHQVYKLTNLSATGRYVKVEVTPTGWSFIDEVEVRQ